VDRAQIFDIELEASAAAAGIDGCFRSGAPQDRTMNIRCYLKREGALDTTQSTAPDYYLVLAGPPSAAVPSRGTTWPWTGHRLRRRMDKGRDLDHVSAGEPEVITVACAPQDRPKATAIATPGVRMWCRARPTSSSPVASHRLGRGACPDQARAGAQEPALIPLRPADHGLCSRAA
jgi:hypothetical protein